MIDLFKFSQQYKVNRSIDVDTFVELGNLTENEVRLLSKSLKSIEIQYDLAFEDQSETIVIAAEIAIDEKLCLATEIAVAIASALPYRSIVFLKKERKARIYTFEERINGINESRSLVEAVRATKTFDSESIDSSAAFVTDNMAKAFLNVKSSDQFEEIINVIIDKATLGFAARFAQQRM